MKTVEDLLREAETHEQPEIAGQPHEDREEAPDHVDIEEHTREGQ